MKTDRFRSTTSNKFWDNFNLNEGLDTLGETARSIWGKPVENTTIIQASEEKEKEKEKDNTMLYVGIGGGVLLLVVLLIVFLR